MVAPFDILNPISGSSVRVDEDLNVASFQGLDGVIGSLLMKWNQQIASMVDVAADEREGRWWPEEVNKATECGLKIGDVQVKQESKLPQFSESFLKLESPSAPWLVLLFTLWYHICQALEESRVELDEGQMVGTHDQIKLGKFKPDGDLIFYQTLLLHPHQKGPR